jgi:hypothetical protein
MPCNERKHLCCNMQCITHATAFATEVGCLPALNPQHSSALAAPVPVVSHYVNAIDTQHTAGLLCQPLPFTPCRIALARFSVAIDALARRTSHAQRMMCVKRDPTIGTRLDQCSVAHERSIHATSTFLVESAALFFHDCLAAVAAAAQRPQVGH